MSNLEAAPQELHCDQGAPPGGGRSPKPAQVLSPRLVPLGGPRAMTVRRTLPQRERWLIGAWCFVDHYGPDDVARTGGMDVPPHPHTGLQTATWLFTGEVEHRDSHGTHAVVRPGELNLMTAGRGICHSEVSTPGTAILHGVQLWIALPDEFRQVERDFRHYAPAVHRLGGAQVRVFLGALAGQVSPVPTFSPLLGAEIALDPGAVLTVDVDVAFEHGVLVDTGAVGVDGTETPSAALAYLGVGRTSVTLVNLADTSARVLLLGGRPLGEDIVMWWNFVARTHDEIAAYRQAWQDESEQFGAVAGYSGELRRLPAPTLPPIRLRPRRSPE